MSLKTMTLAFAMPLAGCAGGVGLNRTPTLASIEPRATADVGSVLNNIKCDMRQFMRNNPSLTKTGYAFGGTLVFTVDRTSTTTASVSVGIPIASSVAKLHAALSHSRAATFGETVSVPIFVKYDPSAKEDANMSHFCDSFYDVQTNKSRLEVVSPRDEKPRSSDNSQRHNLNSPLLGAAVLGSQLGGIQSGQPTITIAAITFQGSIALAEDNKGDGGIDVVPILTDSIGKDVARDYKITYNIGSNWHEILTAAGYNIVGLDPDDKSAPAPSNAVVPEKPSGKETKNSATEKGQKGTANSAVPADAAPLKPILDRITILNLDALKAQMSEPSAPASKPQ